MRSRGQISIALICAAVACTGYDRQSVLDPASPQATSIHQLFYFMLAVAVVTYMLVVGALFAVIRNREASLNMAVHLCGRDGWELENAKEFSEADHAAAFVVELRFKLRTCQR